MISANGGLPAHRYTPQVTSRWPRGSEPASPPWRSVGRSRASGNTVGKFPFDLNKRLPKALMGFPTNSMGIESRLTG